MVKNNYCVYKHTTPNGKAYIGITSINPLRRWKNGQGYNRQERFFRAIIKYGWENIKHEILFAGLSKEEAEAKEIELIALYKTNKPDYGYNIANGGHCVGQHAEETLKKISEANKGVKNPNYGKHPTEETRKKIGEAQKIIVVCLETGQNFNSIREVEKLLGICHSTISACCKGKRKTAGGYHWVYSNE